KHLRQVRLVKREPTGLEGGDPLRDDVTDDHLVPELREAAAGDEPDPPRSEDADCPRFRHADPEAYLGSGCSPRAIASIVSFESESRIVLTTQYVAPFSRSTTMCRCGAEMSGENSRPWMRWMRNGRA